MSIPIQLPSALPQAAVSDRSRFFLFDIVGWCVSGVCLGWCVSGLVCNWAGVLPGWCATGWRCAGEDEKTIALLRAENEQWAEAEAKETETEASNPSNPSQSNPSPSLTFLQRKLAAWKPRAVTRR